MTDTATTVTAKDQALDLFEFLGDPETDQFSFERYYEGERAILRPALEKRGYSDVVFYNIEADSFGPLIRGCRATCHCGKLVRFFYG